MFTFSRRFILAIITVILAFSSLAAAQTFTFTAIPDEDESRLQERFNKVADYLSAELGIEVNYIPVKSYAAAITAFKNNQVQLAWFGGLSGVRARLQVPGSVAIAQGYEDQFFKTYLIAHHSTGLTASENFPADIAEKTFTFGAKGSTSGRLMPEFYIREFFNAAPEDTFRRVGFADDHSQTIAQVQAGAYQVGAVNYKVWENELAAGHIDPSKISVIWSTPTYPDYQWTVRGDLNTSFGDGTIEKVQRALLNMTDPDLLASFPRASFVPASNADYLPIEKTAQAIGLLD